MNKYRKIYLCLLSGIIGIMFTSCLEDNENMSAGVVNPMAYIYEVRECWHGTDVDLSPDMLAGAHLTSGIVISDVRQGNTPADEVVLQSRDKKRPKGIVLALAGGVESTYLPGDSLVVDLQGTRLQRINGNLQITGVTLEKITKCASGITVSPRTLDFTELDMNFANFESMLVSVNAEMYPLPEQGSTLSGEKTLGTDSISIALYTDPGATFASTVLFPSAQFTAIAGWNGAEKQLRMRMGEDMQNGSGPLYKFFPETFESPDESVKNTYAPKVIYLYTGPWYLNMAILGNTAGRDRFNPTGLQCIRMQQGLDTSAMLQMNFDVKYGASKVTLSYGSYYNDASSTWRLELSVDQGRTWEPLGDWISDASAESKVATFMLDVNGNVRFRVNKKGLGKTNASQGIANGRLSIEDFTIYQNEW